MIFRFKKIKTNKFNKDAISSQESVNPLTIRRDHEEKFSSLYDPWMEKASSYLVKLFKQYPKQIDGFSYNYPELNFENGSLENKNSFILRLREDQKFNLETQTINNKGKYSVTLNNDGKGYSIEEVVNSSFGNSDIMYCLTMNPSLRNYIMKELKKRTGVNVKKEINDLVKLKIN